MSKILAILSEKILIPLAIKLGEFLWKRFQISQTNKMKKDIDKKKQALRNAISKAESDEELKNLSIILDDYSEL